MSFNPKLKLHTNNVRHVLREVEELLLKLETSESDEEFSINAECLSSALNLARGCAECGCNAVDELLSDRE